MPTPYYDELLRTLHPNGDLTQLPYDVQNAPPAMREITTKMFNVVSALLYHNVALTEELVRLNVLQRQSPTPLPVAPVTQTVPTYLPTLPTLSMPRLSSPTSMPGGAPGDVTPCDVPQVVITAQGTRVIPPAGTTATPVVLPPNTPVDLTRVQAAPAPPPAPDGVAQVVLPRGGALPAEVQSALAARQGGPNNT